MDAQLPNSTLLAHISARAHISMKHMAKWLGGRVLALPAQPPSGGARRCILATPKQETNPTPSVFTTFLHFPLFLLLPAVGPSTTLLGYSSLVA